MEIIKTKSDFDHKLHDIYHSEPLFVLMTTFGLYAGLSKDNDWHRTRGKFRSETRIFLDNLNQYKIPTYIIVGETMAENCYPGCPSLHAEE